MNVDYIKHTVETYPKGTDLELQNGQHPKYKKVIAEGLDSRDGTSHRFESFLLDINRDTKTPEKQFQILLDSIPTLRDNLQFFEMRMIATTTSILIPVEKVT